MEEVDSDQKIGDFAQQAYTAALLFSTYRRESLSGRHNHYPEKRRENKNIRTKYSGIHTYLSLEGISFLNKGRLWISG